VKAPYPDVSQAGFTPSVASSGYLSCELMLVNVVFNVVPSVLTTVIIAMEMPAAIRPYSMAVAAVSSCQKVLSDFMSIEYAGTS
jgi:hypothetical protein